MEPDLEHDAESGRERLGPSAIDGRPVPAGSVDDQGTVKGVLAALAADGVVGDLRPGTTPATLRCSACGATSDAGDFQVVRERRLEGPSDPDEMVLVIAARCPVCGVDGAIVLGYGPDASGTDSDLVVALSR